MNVIVFEDSAVRSLGVLTAARPASDLLIGGTTLVESLAVFGDVHRSVRPLLARYLASLSADRLPLWGGPGRRPLAAPASRHGGLVLVVNARLVPSREAIAALRGLIEAGHRGIVYRGGAVVAAILHRGGGPTTAADEAAVAAMLEPASKASPFPAPAALEALVVEAGLEPLASDEAAFRLVEQAHEVITAHEHAVEGVMAARIDSGNYRQLRPGLHVAATAHIDDSVVVRGGPVLIEEAAEIGPFVCLDGPCWIGPRTRVNPHAWLRGFTAAGHDCRLGGEIEASVIEPWSNKAHEGYLGHSHLGSWVNIAAGTVSGNLKASYGPVRQHSLLPDGGRTTIHTHRQFLGAMIGDLARTGINASLACGTRIGVAATVAGDVPEQVPAFANLLIGGDRSTPAQAATVLERMMARRGIRFEQADRDLLAAIHESLV